MCSWLTVCSSAGQGADDDGDLHHQMVPAVLHRPSKCLDYLHTIGQKKKKSPPSSRLSLPSDGTGNSSTRHDAHFPPPCVSRNRPRSPSPCACGTSTSWRGRRSSTPWPTPPSSCTRVSGEAATDVLSQRGGAPLPPRHHRLHNARAPVAVENQTKPALHWAPAPVRSGAIGRLLAGQPLPPLGP